MTFAKGDQDGVPAHPAAHPAALNRHLPAPTLITILIVGVLLHVGREVFLPLAVATLLTFALSPAVVRLRAWGLPQIVAVLCVVTLGFAAIGLFFFVVATQFTTLAADLPTFQANIMAKLARLQAAGDGSALFRQATTLLTRIGTAVSTTLSAAEPGSGQGGGPMMVEVVQNQNPLNALLAVVLAIVSPVATTGLVMIVVVFMLLEREDLRDRFIRLVGAHDLHRTTEMLHDAGSRVASYLLIQLLVNVIYALPIGVGLWLIGVPNPLLWAMLTLVLRFVPYIGSALAAIFPIALAFAVSPDWSLVIWTVALFVVVELVTSNMIEPWLYGSRTGLSPLAVIIAAIVWVFIWGPLGLILSTPLTVCLVVLGRYLPPFQVFDIIFGDEPVLAPFARLYQRLLAGDVVESAARAEGDLDEIYIADYHQDVIIPALLLAQGDYDRGVLHHGQMARVADTAQALMAALVPLVDEELAADQVAADVAPVHPGAAVSVAVAVAGGRSVLDDASAAALAQVMHSEGVPVQTLSRGALAVADALGTPGGATAMGCLILCYLDPQPPRGGLLILRRIKRAYPTLRVGVVFWDMPPALRDMDQMMVPNLRLGQPATAAAVDIGADFVVRTIAEAITEAGRQVPALPLTAPAPKKTRGAQAKRRLAAIA